MTNIIENSKYSINSFMNESLYVELEEYAVKNGININELVIDFIVNGLRCDIERNYPSFIVHSDYEKSFTDDGFRVIKRYDGYSVLCPFNGIPFDDVSARLQENILRNM